MTGSFCLRVVAISTAFIACACGDDDTPSSADDLPGGIQPGTVIRLLDGSLQGSAEGGARRFWGIPYARPPVGELRWKAPVKNEPWPTTSDATQFGGRCAQPDSLNTGPGTDNEDCLYLNVWTPDPAPEKPLPVVFWIHGGGNQNGAASDLVPGVGVRLFYDGQSFAANHEVVFVSLNYRLGMLGYLSHPALRA